MSRASGTVSRPQSSNKVSSSYGDKEDSYHIHEKISRKVSLAKSVAQGTGGDKTPSSNFSKPRDSRPASSGHEKELRFAMDQMEKNRESDVFDVKQDATEDEQRR